MTPLIGSRGAVALQQVEEARPARLVGGTVAVLGGLAAGGVEQHRLVGEEPVAVARAADALELLRACPSGKRRPDWSSAVVLPEPGGPMITYQGSW